jgi:hypothetical protein
MAPSFVLWLPLLRTRGFPCFLFWLGARMAHLTLEGATVTPPRARTGRATAALL